MTIKMHPEILARIAADGTIRMRTSSRPEREISGNEAATLVRDFSNPEEGRWRAVRFEDAPPPPGHAGSPEPDEVSRRASTTFPVACIMPTPGGGIVLQLRDDGTLVVWHRQADVIADNPLKTNLLEAFGFIPLTAVPMQIVVDAADPESLRGTTDPAATLADIFRREINPKLESPFLAPGDDIFHHFGTDEIFSRGSRDALEESVRTAAVMLFGDDPGAWPMRSVVQSGGAIVLDDRAENRRLIFHVLPSGARTADFKLTASQFDLSRPSGELDERALRLLEEALAENHFHVEYARPKRHNHRADDYTVHTSYYIELDLEPPTAHEIAERVRASCAVS